MATKGENLAHWRGRGQALALGLVLLALTAGGAPRGSGLGCAGGVRDKGESSERMGPARLERRPAAFRERVEQRERMVKGQVEAREVRDPNVLRALRIVPRHAFVPEVQQAYAYEDRPLYIGYGQTISQPYVVAFMTEALRLDADSVVLEIGTGSGYQAAICAEIARAVYTIEIVEPLATAASRRLRELGYANISVRAGDGYDGWPEKGPFDAIIGTAAAEEIPPPLLEQLKKGGRMILPVGGQFGLQYLVLVTRDEQGQVHRQNVMPVLFVPMTGRSQSSDAAREKSRE
jgi:protein-L-isoaspartate(D-aspartate) O-methyltransferase